MFVDVKAACRRSYSHYRQ